MVDSPQSWFGAPVLETEERTERARAVWRLLWLALGVGVAFILLLIAVQPETLFLRLRSIAVLVSVALVAHALNRAGKTPLASWVLVAGIGGLLTWRSLISGGVTAPQTTGLIAVVLLAGLLLGTAAGVATGIACAGASLGMVVAERTGHLPMTEIAFNPLTIWVYNAIWIALAIVLQDQVARSLGAAQGRARKELVERQASEDKFSRVFAAVPAGLAVSALADGRFVAVNDEFERIYGWRRDEVIGRTSGELQMWPEAPQRADFTTKVNRAGGDARDVELILRGKDGRERIMRTSGHVIEIEGELMLVTTFVDVTERKRTEEAQRASDRRFGAIFRESPVALAVTDRDSGKLIDVNEAFLHMMRASSFDQVLGKTSIEVGLLTPEARQKLIEERLKGGSTRGYVGEGRRLDGEPFSGEAAVATYELDGRHYNIASITDITDRLRAEREREISLKDLAERVKELRLLHQTARLFQRETGDLEALLHEWVLLIPPAWQYAECCEARVVVAGITAATPGWRESPWRQTARLATNQGEGLLEVAYLEARPDAVEGPFLAEERTVLESLAEMIEAYIDLRTHREALEQLVARRTRQLAENYDRLKGLEELRDDLVHMVVHDMRSPLTILMAHLEYLKNGVGRVLEGQAVGDLEAAVRATDVVTRMANDLIDVSRMEEGKLPLVKKPHDLVQIAGDVRAALAASQRTRTIEVDATGSVQAVCDAAIVHRVIENLVSNAIKHTPTGGRIRITVTPGLKVRVAVHDQGPGVPVEARERIFEKFRTIDSAQSRNRHSAGLGLAFCKLAVEAHEGAIGVESGEAVGSVFWFEIPA